MFARNIVSTSHPLAAQAGLRMLQRAATRSTRAIAAAAVMTIVEPCSNGLGSDAFCILWDGKQLHGLNASGPAPAAWTPEYFRAQARRRRDRAAGARLGLGDGARRGGRAGSRFRERFGKLPFADLLAPAIEVAERGYAVPVVVQQKWVAGGAAAAATQPGFAEAFLPHGRPPEVGERFALPGGRARARGDRRRRAARRSTAARSRRPRPRMRARTAAR